MHITLSPDQKRALDSLLAWHKDGSHNGFISLGGYAGTGKTTLLGILRRKLHKENEKLKVAFVSYTGKATRVLRQKLTAAKTAFDQDSVSTIHALIYSPIVDDNEEIVGWERKKKIECDLIVVDEASMVDENIWRDLVAYDVPIIAVGDHGQLPPISGSFSLMANPLLRLEKIHRQAEGNPVIQLSLQAREMGNIPPGSYGEGVYKLSRRNTEDIEKVNSLLAAYDYTTMILCGYNSTRAKLNNHIRTILGFESTCPQQNDKIICLRNNHKKQIFNGMTGIINSIIPFTDDWYTVTVNMDGEEKPYEGDISAKQFSSQQSLNFTDRRSSIMDGDLFDFGYAFTVHKAQGSQAKKVILFEERFKQMDDEMWRRWLYTGVTRAEEELILVGD
ncbi:AAA family ATPase [Candidatus Roizmanbacteria bacterium]|nr:AAA family ATPase [Candidatus Roizmanbacteria bacterium]